MPTKSVKSREQISRDVLSEQNQFDRELQALKAANAAIYSGRRTPWPVR
jgi:hypothetical protein